MKLTPSQLRTLPQALPKWKIIDNQLHRTLKFQSFEDTWGFLTKLAMRSHLMKHHPKIINCYTDVDIYLTTHDENGITELDTRLAKRIDKYVAE
ncbi:Putative 4a-hydroxytetrahydrobiopterin dehydratase [Komagataella phaffii CBS 7435]|uniref:4a-hydroxytetrahydrobiopterin dehydratase n=2 Tax=Komagataella phaffii TaxID=460519 RepID=C4QXG6_KOMPG|nr:pterin-4-alpha-carbinolamine dehydratase [Komagataella phaffii GS115]CAH2446752.1 Putative 4a-hydroxytetrahydrobiopterin dehydratase [Komagataella phaffii CBS 7435]CAY67939.1 pterin-4-alpha-carbinolamine dehydratase [Komagataella phaffii GS115]SCV11871.1 Putative 4a-hydroxytetrahydrobiopterin dehydratase [Komagataella phaffii CBS 7435]